jgi:hypothetical protein
MKNHRSLRHSIMPGGGSAAGAHRSPSAGIARLRVMRGILVLALTLGGVAAVALAWPGQVSAGHARVAVQQRAHGPARPAGLHLMVSKSAPRPWMY